MFTKQQINSLHVLKSYGVNISEFIRSAVREKIRNEWKTIKEPKVNKKDCPF
jgi:hypothetical protein